MEGIAVFVSSGDDGSAECLAAGNSYLPKPCVSYPAGDPSVTSVGGVTVALDPFGQIEGPIVAWGISTSNNKYGALNGSGGGTSTFIPAPPWQASQIGATMREQPDVSMIGDPETGVAVVQNASFSGGPSDIGGTSVAAPQMAAMWGLVLNACKLHPATGGCPVSAAGRFWRLGNAAPYFYAIYKGATVNGFAPHASYAQTFYDVLYGSNQMASNPGSTTPATPVPGASAMTGYDKVTGVGVPYAAHLINAIAGLSLP
jgi:kumamolisin